MLKFITNDFIKYISIPTQLPTWTVIPIGRDGVPFQTVAPEAAHSVDASPIRTNSRLITFICICQLFQVIIVKFVYAGSIFLSNDHFDPLYFDGHIYIFEKNLNGNFKIIFPQLHPTSGINCQVHPSRLPRFFFLKHHLYLKAYNGHITPITEAVLYHQAVQLTWCSIAAPMISRYSYILGKCCVTYFHNNCLNSLLGQRRYKSTEY